MLPCSDCRFSYKILVSVREFRATGIAVTPGVEKLYVVFASGVGVMSGFVAASEAIETEA